MSTLRNALHRIDGLAILTEGGTLFVGGLVSAAAINLFIAPHQIAPGGASGLAIILTSIFPFPLGMTMLVLNIPAFVLGYRALGGGAFLARSLFATLVFNLAVDLMQPLFPAAGITDEMILNSLFGGALLGIGIGLIYRAGGTAGAGGIINRLIQHGYGLPIKLSTLYTNGLIILLAGFVFGWEAAMFALISFYLAGSVADFVLEGPSVVRTALIITDESERVGDHLMRRLGRGVTRWSVQGMYTNRPHTALYCTVTRPQVHELKRIVAAADPEAFVIVGQGQEALGKGFRDLRKERPRAVKIGTKGSLPPEA